MKKYLGIAGACMLAVWGTASFAASSDGTIVVAQASQSDAPGTTTGAANNNGTVKGPMTIDQIDVNKPFGDLTFDPKMSMADMDKKLTAEQRTDIHARCDLIVQDAGKFAQDVPGWCASYNDYYAKTYPAQ